MGMMDPDSTILVARGETKTLRLTITQEGGTPLDLTSATLYMTVKRFMDDKSILIAKVSTNPLQISITRPKHGEAEIYLVSSDTRALAPTDYVYDIWVVLPGDKRYPVILPGQLTVEASITTFP